jgi:hypothetical protein
MHLTVGVTGHRNLVAAEIPALKQKVREFFLRLRAEYPDLTLQLITPLAEGADRLVTDVAVDLGVELLIVLPMPQTEYEKDFSSQQATEEFRGTVDAARVIQLPAVSPDKATAGILSSRQRQYAQLGVFVSNHCQVLLALWDGKETREVGGTAGVVNYHLMSVMPGYSIVEMSPNLLANNENDLCYHIVCSRDQIGGQPEQGLQPQEAAWVTASYGRTDTERMPPDYEIMLHRLQDYSLDITKYQAQIDEQGFDLLGSAPQLECPSGVSDIGTQHSIADWLAIHFQKRVSGSLIATHSIAVVVGLVFILYSELDGFTYLVNVFLLAFLTGYIIYKIGERRHWHRKYLDYRALAEGLRVQFYWSLAGVIDMRSAEFAYDNFLQKQDVDLGWIRHVMRNLSLTRSREQTPSPEWLGWVIEEWVGDESSGSGQLAYYQRKQSEKAKRFKMTTMLGTLALGIGIVIALILAVFGNDISDFQRQALLVMMGTFPLIAGVRDAYSYKRAEKELIKQYRFMHSVFKNARRLLDSSDDPAFQRRVLRALGSAALEEDAEWILMHRERPMEHTGLQA